MRKRLDRGPTRLGRAASMVAGLAVPAVAHAAITIPTVNVGNANNAADPRVANDGTGGYGAVGYAYSIGKYEVTAGQYAAFLNAVAATDTYGLYNPRMASDAAGCQIVRTGTPGNYTYSVASDYADRPVNYVSWGDSARFANWLSNGQAAGTQTPATTENGAYTLSGAASASALANVTRNASATWFVASENEWYKAAFYDPATASYFNYATASNTLPGNTLADPDPGNNANYRNASNVDTLAGPYYRTEVGAFENSDSPYGTFDQNGNVWEWNESTYLGQFKEMRGGAIGTYDVTLASSFRYFDAADYEANTVGFRVSSSLISTAVNLLASDAAGSSSFASGLNFGVGGVPVLANAYGVGGGLTLRTVTDGGSAAFGGGSLTVGDNGASAGILLLKNASGSTVTINNLTLNKGAVINGGDGTGAATSVTVAGNGVTLAAGGGTLDSGAAGRTLTVSNVINGTGPLTVGGDGTVVLTAANTYTGVTTVAAGTLRSASAASTAALLNTTNGVDLAAGAELELAYTGTSPVAAVRSILTAGYAQPGKFAAGRLRSGTLAAGRTIGYGDDGGVVTVRVTLPGDADLDGDVDFADFVALQSSFGGTDTRFDQGNFDYDTDTDFADFVALQSNFGQSLSGARVAVSRAEYAAVMGILTAAQVPEPAGLALAGLMGVGLLRRKRA